MAVDSVLAGRVEVELQQLVVFALVVEDRRIGGVDLDGMAVEENDVFITCRACSRALSGERCEDAL